MNKKLKTIVEDIFKMESTDLSAVIDAVKMRRNQLHTADAHKFKFGDRVRFEGRQGRTLQGTVERVKIKYILVRTDLGQKWNVPGSHLTLIQSKEAVDA